MDFTRREMLVILATAPLAASLPSLALAEPPPHPPADPYLLDELPMSGFAGECSGWH